MSSREKIWQNTRILSDQNTIGYELVANSANGIIIIDADGQIVVVNQVLNTIFGYHEDELLGLRLEQLIPESFKATHVNHRNDYIKSPTPRAMGQGRDLSGLHKDGSEIPIEMHIRTMSIRFLHLIDQGIAFN